MLTSSRSRSPPLRSEEVSSFNLTFLKMAGGGGSPPLTASLAGQRSPRRLKRLRREHLESLVLVSFSSAEEALGVRPS